MKKIVNKNIGIDLDGVLCDWTYGYSKLLRKLYGTIGNPLVHSGDKRIITWGWEGWYPGFTKEKQNLAWNHLKEKEVDFWYDLSATPEALQINWNFTINNNVFFISNRPQNQGKHFEKWGIQSETIAWLYKALGVRTGAVIIAENKGEIARSLNLDYFIDDKLSNCLEVATLSPNTQVYMPIRGHNQGSHKIVKTLQIKEIQTILKFPPFRSIKDD